MFAISNKVDYGLLIISKLSRADEYIPLSRIVEETRLPHRFTARIAADLVRHGILISREGKIGGYKLAKELKKITLLEFLKIFEQDIGITKCQDPQYKCSFEHLCSHHSFFRNKLTTIFTKELNNWTLKDLILDKPESKNYARYKKSYSSYWR